MTIQFPQRPPVGVPPMPLGMMGPQMGRPPQMQGGPPAMQPANPPPDPMRTAQAIALLKNDTKRTFRIDIETDSTIQVDEQADKQGRVEFLTAFGTLVEKALPLVQAMPQAAPLVGEMMGFMARGFKAGVTLEDAIDRFSKDMEQAAMQAAQNPKPDPETAKVQAQIEGDKARLQLDAQKAQQDAQVKQQAAAQDAQLQQQTGQAEMALEMKRMQAELMMAMQKMHAEMAMQRQELQARLAMDAHAHAAEQARADRQQAIDAAREPAEDGA